MMRCTRIDLNFLRIQTSWTRQPPSVARRSCKPNGHPTQASGGIRGVLMEGERKRFANAPEGAPIAAAPRSGSSWWQACTGLG